ncbi:MAG: SBBP repeat-containing protein, partial [bacterium]|nr:SBBP repeat-containing protein [bacterium]
RTVSASNINSGLGTSWSTYLGGIYNELAYAVATDTSGNIYVTGVTTSSGWVRGGYDISFNGMGSYGFTNGGDIILSKFNSSGQHLWSTYLGGDVDDCAQCIALDSNVIFISPALQIRKAGFQVVSTRIWTRVMDRQIMMNIFQTLS